MDPIKQWRIVSGAVVGGLLIACSLYLALAIHTYLKYRN